MTNKDQKDKYIEEVNESSKPSELKEGDDFFADSEENKDVSMNQSNDEQQEDLSKEEVEEKPSESDQSEDFRTNIDEIRDIKDDEVSDQKTDTPSVNDEEKASDTNEGDDFFDRLDEMRGVTDDQLQDKLPKDPSDEIEERVTKAFQTLSDTDQDVMSRTKMIHIDPNIPIETQMMKTITLQKQTENHRKKIMKIIIGFMIAGIVVSLLGLLSSKLMNSSSSTTAAPSVNPNAISSTANDIQINEVSFPDATFREYIQTQADKDGNGLLNASERNSFLILSIQSNPTLTSVKGIELFPLLQAISISNCPVTELDVSKLSEIENINISGTAINTLDLSNNEKMKSLNVSNTKLESLELSSTAGLTEVKTNDSNVVCNKDNQNLVHSCEITTE